MSELKGIINRRKSPMSLTIVYILISVMGGVVGQILLKKGMGDMGPLTLATDQLGNTLWRMGTDPFVITGLAVYVCSTIFWLVALSRVELSYAYPFVSLSYVVMLAASWLLFQENITSLRLLGSFVVILGVVIISQS